MSQGTSSGGGRARTDRAARVVLEKALARGIVSAAAVLETEKRLDEIASRGGAADAGPQDVLAILREVSGVDGRLLEALDDRSLIGRALGGFRIESKIGEGGQGAVYRATQVSLGRPVALKVLDPTLACRPELAERFRREGRAAARLDHPHVVQPIDFGEDSGFLFFAMELMEGGSAVSRTFERGPLSEKEAVEVALAVARALEYAETQGLVHRDIKPDNILFSKHGTVKLADLGLVLEQDQEAPITKSGAMIGTPHYMPPEQALGERDLDVRSDIYSLGATIYEVVAGEPPFEGSAVTILMKHVSGPFPDVRTRAPHVSARFASVVARMTARKREDRYPTARELREALETLASGTSGASGAAAPAPMGAATAGVGPDEGATLPGTPAISPSPPRGEGRGEGAAIASAPAPGSGLDVEDLTASAAARVSARPTQPFDVVGSGSGRLREPRPLETTPPRASPLAMALALAAVAALAIAGLAIAYRLGRDRDDGSGTGAGEAARGAPPPGAPAPLPVIDPAAEVEGTGRLRDLLLVRCAGTDKTPGLFVGSDPWSTAQALAALALASPPPPREDVGRLAGYLRRTPLKGPNGECLGWAVLADDTAGCIEVSAWVGIAFAAAAAVSDADREATVADRAVVRRYLVGVQSEDGGFPSVPVAGPGTARVTGSALALAALVAIEAAELGRRPAAVGADPDVAAEAARESARALEAIERGARWLGARYEQALHAWFPHPRALFGNREPVHGLSEFVAWTLLEAQALLELRGRALPAEARVALADYAGSFKPSDLPLTTLGVPNANDYIFELPAGLRCSLQAPRWIYAPWRLLACERIAREGRTRAADWAAEAARLRARIPTLASEFAQAPTFQLCELVFGVHLLRSLPAEDRRAGSLVRLLADGGR